MKNMISIRAMIGILFSSIFICITQAEDPWRFLVLADWHGAEYFSRFPGRNTTVYKTKLSMFSYINQTYGGDLIFAPGDSNSGKWYTDSYISTNFPGKTPQEAVYAAGINCYGTMKDLFAQAGYEKLLMAVGDHELGNDGWEPNSAKTLSLPQYRASFSKGFNQDVSTDEFLYTSPIGEAPATPIGTTFENTSFAYQYKNVLFVTVDAFNKVEGSKGYFSREEGVGGAGVVTGEVTGDHLDWFEFVLEEAGKDPTIKHIFVQSHLPILHPVRKINTSAMFIDYAEESDFWKTMVKHKVDIYFAGEVHSNTVSMNSNVIQVVSRGNAANNFLTVDVRDDSIILKSYNEVGNLPRGYNQDHVEYGAIQIYKYNHAGTDDVAIISDGSLEMVDNNLPLIHFDFERITKLVKRPIVGMNHDDVLTTLEQTKITIRGEKCRKSVPNKGAFSQQYDAQVFGVKLFPGVVGEYSGRFNYGSRFGVYSFGPPIGGHVISFAVWIQTWSYDEELTVMHYGSTWGVHPKTDTYILTLKEGNPTLYLKNFNTVVPKSNLTLADGRWHHIAAVMPQKSCRMSDILLYIDGELIDTKVDGIDNHVYFITTGRLSLGGFGFSDERYEEKYPNMKPFIGYMDDFYMWGRAVDSDEIISLRDKASINLTDLECIEVPKARFVKRIKKKDGVVTAKTNSCLYLSNQTPSKIAELCARILKTEEYGSANEVCCDTCQLGL